MGRVPYQVEGGGEAMSEPFRPQNRPVHTGPGRGELGAQPAPGLVSDEELRAIVVRGDAEALVNSAKKIGEALSRDLSSSQLRGVFGTIRRIEMSWPSDTDPEAARQRKMELLLLKPRLAYQVGRARQGSAGERRGIITLEPVLRRAIEMVSDRPQFQHLANYLEAIVAYHRFAGGK